MLVNKDEETIADELKFWDRISNIKIKTAYDFEVENSCTMDEFQSILSEYFGVDNISFYIGENNELTVVDTKNHSVILSVCGHMDGDTYGGWRVYFVPDILNTQCGSYYKKVYLGRLRDYCFRNENLFVINTETLTKYDKEGSALWEAGLTDDRGIEVSQLRFNYTHRYPDSSYPNNLIAVSDAFDLLYYYEDSGKFYGKRRLAVVK